ncbi:hypothetical protein TVAG_356070 [Trichomonas vaginalis G3]|uniref:DUF3447 domain-containing protein n=1 Tax=Trichomonas vaginalis (strain ATCC PRA-98 / G3) TaxID=412133 RepID=A2FK49_TRIV3|nr:spectrin binding [Trichomonas vaginalis G3]EAX94728.1 hypothetical protein TVAG_356070 [Trichomonas vaginalis G3]KAI5539635.1 spectrin binding [Trichomonas vaginalis G3]|eukprot:XP_001307658.1 hypothetical protein [Trichomonas vaginalis G3]
MHSWLDGVLLQSKLDKLTESSIGEDAIYISELEISKSLNGIYRIASILSKYISQFPRKSPLYAAFIKELDSLSSEKNCLSDLCTVILQNLIKWSENNRILYDLIDLGCISEEDVVAEYAETSNGSVMILPILLKYDVSLYRRLFLSNDLRTYTSKLKQNLDKLENNIEYYKSCLYYRSLPGTPEWAIITDDVDLLSNLFPDPPDFLSESFTRELISTTYISYLDFAASIGSVNCFKYMLQMRLNNQGPIYSGRLLRLSYNVITGGNFEILRIFQNECNFSFISDEYIDKSILTFNNDILRWILEDVEISDQILNQAISACLQCNNIEALVMILRWAEGNGKVFDINQAQLFNTKTEARLFFKQQKLYPSAHLEFGTDITTW